MRKPWKPLRNPAETLKLKIFIWRVKTSDKQQLSGGWKLLFWETFKLVTCQHSFLRVFTWNHLFKIFTCKLFSLKLYLQTRFRAIFNLRKVFQGFCRFPWVQLCLEGLANLEPAKAGEKSSRSLCGVAPNLISLQRSFLEPEKGRISLPFWGGLHGNLDIFLVMNWCWSSANLTCGRTDIMPF